ncbi:MAG: hypothetical protein J6X44_10370, partial [Thermoguttaceae bacterium]|nr:hypothetical protein [Thermoguttaceae bacterium]
KGSKDVLRVEGASIGGFGGLKEQLFLVAFLSIFLLVGVVMGVVLPIRDGARMLKILKNGEAAYGSYDKTDATGARINGIPVCDVRFNFVTNAMEEGVATARTIDPEKLLDQPNFPLLYLPENPKRTVLLNSLPDGVKLKPNEGFQASFWKILPRLILAAIVIAEIAATCVLSTKIERATFFIASAETSEPAESVESAKTAVDAGVRP